MEVQIQMCEDLYCVLYRLECSSIGYKNSWSLAPCSDTGPQYYCERNSETALEDIYVLYLHYK